jgi:hypothetical protein
MPSWTRSDDSSLQDPAGRATLLSGNALSQGSRASTCVTPLAVWESSESASSGAKGVTPLFFRFHFRPPWGTEPYVGLQLRLNAILTVFLLVYSHADAPN